jgi:hypothetical protein
MKFGIHLLIVALLAYVTGGFIPYWVLMMLIAGISAWFKGSAVIAFIAGALGVAIVWILVPLVIWSSTGSDLPDSFSAILGFSDGKALVGITGLMGFFIGGSSALTGNFFGKLFMDRNDGY